MTLPPPLSSLGYNPSTASDNPYRCTLIPKNEIRYTLSSVARSRYCSCTLITLFTPFISKIFSNVIFNYTHLHIINTPDEQTLYVIYTNYINA